MPDDLRRAALAGGEAALLSARIQANSRCIDRLALAAVRNAAIRRMDGEIRYWRGQGMAWHSCR